MGRKTVEINPKSGYRVKHICEEQGITQNRLSEIIHYTAKHVSDMITGKKGVSLQAAQAINKAFPLYRVEWILGLDDYYSEGFKESCECNGPWIQYYEMGEALEQLLRFENGSICVLESRNARISFEDPEMQSFELPPNQAFLLFQELSDMISTRLEWEWHRMKLKQDEITELRESTAEEGDIANDPQEQ